MNLIKFLLPLLFIPVFIKAQVLNNPSFEGTHGASTSPPNWSPCGNGSTPDTQPGAFEVNTLPSDGKSFVSLVCRGPGSSFENLCEIFQQDLPTPFLPQHCYRFSVDLAVSSTMFASGFGDKISFAQPLRLKIWGGIFSCDEFTLIWESPMVAHTDWKKYYFDVITDNHQYNYIILEAIYAWSPTYFGNILIDNIRYLPEINIPETVVICEGSITELNNIEGAQTYWTTSENDTIVQPDSTGIYTVHINSASCSLTDTVNVFIAQQPPLATITKSNDTLISSVDSTDFIYQWYVNDQPIQGANEPHFITYFSGDYSLTIVDSSGNCSTTTNIITLNYPAINIFPNPSDGMFILAISNEGDKELQVEVFNVLGQVIYNSANETITGNTLKEIDLRGVALGTYYIRVIINNQPVTKKVSVLRTYGN